MTQPHLHKGVHMRMRMHLHKGLKAERDCPVDDESDVCLVYAHAKGLRTSSAGAHAHLRLDEGWVGRRAGG